MAKPIRLVLLIDDPEDVREFEENMQNPKVTKEQVEFFKRAIKVYKAQRLWFMHPRFFDVELWMVSYAERYSFLPFR